jgi:2',3'-cyclic-nucleotide 2'-phosphodiesterase (5'-nucleotidase family)
MVDSGPVIRYVNDTERAYDAPERVGWLADALCEGDPARTLVVDGGDSTALGALPLATDAPTDHALPFFDAVSPAVHVPGNHDFDDGDSHLAAVRRETDGKWLAANLDGADPEFDSVAVFERAGRTIGVVGVSHPDTRRLNEFVAEYTASGTPLSDDLAFGAPLPAAERGLDRLHERGVDHAVVVAHCGAESERIAAETDADVVLGAHDHRRAVDTVEGTLLARTAGHGRSVAEVRLDEPTVSFREAGAAANGVAAQYRDRLAAAGLDSAVATLDEPLDSAGVRRLAVRALQEATGADVAAVPLAAVRGELAGDVTRADAVGTVPFRLPTATFGVSESALESLLAAANDATSVFEQTVWCGADPAAGTVDATPDEDGEYRVATVYGLVQSRLVPGDAATVDATHAPLHEVLTDHLQSQEQCRAE